jgi:hypothetical protein
MKRSIEQDRQHVLFEVSDSHDLTTKNTSPSSEVIFALTKSPTQCLEKDMSSLVPVHTSYTNTSYAAVAPRWRPSLRVRVCSSSRPPSATCRGSPGRIAARRRPPLACSATAQRPISRMCGSLMSLIGLHPTHLRPAAASCEPPRPARRR